MLKYLQSRTALTMSMLSVVCLAFVSLVVSQEMTKPVTEEKTVALAVPDYALRDDSENYEVKVLPVGLNRVLVKVEDNFYLVSDDNQILWQARADSLGEIIMDSKGRVFGIGADMAHFAIALDSGEIDFFSERGRPVSGRNYLTQIRPYKDGHHLVVESFREYRKCSACSNTMLYDYLTGWDGKQLLWKTRIPPDALIEVSNDKIIAVTKNSKGAVIQEIVPSQFQIRYE